MGFHHGGQSWEYVLLDLARSRKFYIDCIGQFEGFIRPDLNSLVKCLVFWFHINPYILIIFIYFSLLFYINFIFCFVVWLIIYPVNVTFELIIEDSNWVTVFILVKIKKYNIKYSLKMLGYSKQNSLTNIFYKIDQSLSKFYSSRPRALEQSGSCSCKRRNL